MILKRGIFFLMVTFAASSLFAVNLFSTNSGFETATTPWKLSFNDTTKANAKMSLDSVGVKFGKKYCKINVTKVDADSVGHNWYIQLWEPTWTPKTNVKYTYSCWAKSADSISRMIHIAATGKAPDSEYVYRDGKSFTLTKEWQLCEFSYTWTDASTKMHFRLFIGGATGAICFDSMALDTGAVTMARVPFVMANHNETGNYAVQVMPDCMRIDLGTSASVSNRVAIYSVGGRLHSSYTIPVATSMYEIPKPSSGAWVVDVNSHKRMIQIP